MPIPKWTQGATRKGRSVSLTLGEVGDETSGQFLADLHTTVLGYPENRNRSACKNSNYDPTLLPRKELFQTNNLELGLHLKCPYWLEKVHKVRWWFTCSPESAQHKKSCLGLFLLSSWVRFYGENKNLQMTESWWPILLKHAVTITLTLSDLYITRTENSL